MPRPPGQRRLRPSGRSRRDAARGPASHFRRTIRAIDDAPIHTCLRPSCVDPPCALPLLCLTALLLPLVPDASALAQSPGAKPRIEWEVKNRFRLFRSEADFQRHVASWRNDGVLGSEQRLAIESDGRGWARDTVERLCVDRAGRLMEFCERDGTREVYLSPGDHRIGVVLAAAPADAVNCVWTFEDGASEPRQFEGSCEEEMRLRIVHGRPTTATVDIVLPDGTAQRVVTEIAGARRADRRARRTRSPPAKAIPTGRCGSPTKASASAASSASRPASTYRPGRAGYTGNRSCVTEGSDPHADAWARQSARWHSGPCHRSLYGYQMRAALGLAIENPRIAVTFIPLACSGATIAAGFLGSQRITECPSPGTNTACSTTSPAQIATLTQALATARKHRADRGLDLVLLTIGANDIQFAGLVADVIIESRTERLLFGRSGHIASVADSQRILDRNLPNDFLKLRAALKPLVGGNLARVVFVSYGHPALAAPGTSCPGGRNGFDVHPAFGADPQRLRQRGRVRLQRVPAEDQGHRALRRQALPRSADRADDLRRRPPGGVRAARRLRALGAGSRIRSRLLRDQRRDLPHAIRRARPTIRSPAAVRRASTARMRRGRAGCAPPTTATSPP